jgi:hypothetical protein
VADCERAIYLDLDYDDRKLAPRLEVPREALVCAVVVHELSH